MKHRLYGACVAAAQLRMRTLPGVSRPGIAVIIPTFHGPVVICDVGANVAPKPKHLEQYAIMAASYATAICGIENPRVGLISIGEEDAKGTTTVKEARKLTLDMLKPGTPCKDIWEAFNAFMRKHGRPEEARLYCHGQGYDLVERPLIRSDEPWTIQKDMNIVVHPTYPYGGYLNWLCDNYLIGGNGPGDRLHQFPEEVIEVG